MCDASLRLLTTSLDGIGVGDLQSDGIRGKNKEETTLSNGDVFKELFEMLIDHFKSHEAQNAVKSMVTKFIEASYTLDVNRALGSVFTNFGYRKVSSWNSNYNCTHQ